MEHSSTIAIIGAGFSGSLVATHLLKTAHQPLCIKLIDCRHAFGQGVAYSTQSPHHLLNVAAGKMSAFADEPEHFLQWLCSHRHQLDLPIDLSAKSFIPRSIYGLYLQSILETAIATASPQVQLEAITDEVVAIKPEGDRVRVLLRQGATFSADQAVLALGNAPKSLPGEPLSLPPSCHRHAWSTAALDDLAQDATVLLVGTGLTMVDMVVSLHDRQHQGPIYAISRRGLAPLVHQTIQPYAAWLAPAIAAKTTRGLVAQIRREVQTATQQGYDWRSVIDALRPVIPQLWQQLPHSEQRRFLNHVLPYWDVHRHRIAPAMATIVNTLRETGQLTLLAGRILSYQPTEQGLAVTIRQRRSSTEQALRVDRLVNCTGISVDYRRSSAALIANLREQGLIRPNALGLGLDTTPDGTVLDAQGQPSRWLHTLGPPRKGDLWETTAVPELRQQALALASTLLQSLPSQNQRPLTAAYDL